MTIQRRDFLRSGLVATGALLLGPGRWLPALADHEPGHGYGPLQAADLNGIMLPPGFTSKLVALAGLPVVATAYVWHTFPDGAATFPTSDGGWILVSNSEVPFVPLGGAGAVRFAADGSVVDAYRVLDATTGNCAGGPTPWGTWLSCEEYDAGRVWECDPYGVRQAVAHDAMGVFSHESAAVDPVHQAVYLTEDKPDGRFYRYLPDAYPDLSIGTLQVAATSSATGGDVTWLDVPDPTGAVLGLVRNQVAGTRVFNGGEGTWYDAGIVYFTTKGDNRVWTYDTVTSTMDVLYDDNTTPGAPLTGVDNVVVSSSGDLFVAEDGGDMDIVMIAPDGSISRLLKFSGRQHSSSELAGPTFSPDGTRFYVSSQRSFGRGATYEVTGPFRT